MKIGDKNIESIIVTSKEDEVICVISDNEIIESKRNNNSGKDGIIF